MSGRSDFLAAGIEDFITATTVREDPLLAALRAETAAMPEAGMQIGPAQGQFMALLARAIGAKRYLEIGVFTGYSSLVMALAMPGDARVVACDVSDEYTAMARRYWARAGVAERIDLRIGPALKTLDALIAAGTPPFDVAFIDADKVNYDGYYERALRLLRPGGLIMIDNTLWSGRVADPNETDENTVALRAIDAKAGADERVDVALLSIGDGLLIARKR